MTAKKKTFLIFILGTLSAIGPFSIDMYLPGFPAIARDLNTDVATVSLSLSSFFIGICVGQMLYGPLLDRFGRKKPLYFGLTLYLLTSLGCAFATSVEALIVLRFLQAVGGCVGMVASRAMVRDLFPVEESAKVFSMLMLVIGVSPLIAPTLGGYISAGPGWQYIFIALTFMAGAILAGVHYALPESREPDPEFSLKPVVIVANFMQIFKNPQFYTYSFTGSVAAAGLYAYISGSPLVFMEIFKVTEQQYGWIFAGIAAGLIVSSQMNSLLLRRFSSQQIIVVALALQSAIGMVLIVGTINGSLDVYGTVLLIFLFLCCQGFTFPNASALALAPFHKQAGSASALTGAIQMGLGAFASAMLSVFNDNSAIPMTAVMSGCSLSALVILLIGKRIIRLQSDKKEEVQTAMT